MGEKDQKPGRKLKCAICREPIGLRPENRYFPFCSERCQMVDLGKWMDEEYTIPVGRTSTERSLPKDDEPQ